MKDREIKKAIEDALVYGKGIIRDGKRVDPNSIYKEPAPAQINEEVARKLGWTVKHRYGPQLQDGITKDERNYYPLPNFCRDIAAAWWIVDWCEANDIGVILDNVNGWRCNLCDDADHIAEDDTAAMSICLAFLKLP